MKEQVFGFRKKEGTVSVYRKAEMKKLIASLEDGEYEYVLRKKKKKRNIPLNSLFHVYVSIISKEIKKSPEWVKIYLKQKFLTIYAKDDYGQPIINKETGEVLTEIRGISELTNSELYELCEDVRLHMMEFDIYLEKPNEQGELKFTDL